MNTPDHDRLHTALNVLYHLPVAVIGVDEYGMITLANHKAAELFANGGELPLLGELAQDNIPQDMLSCIADKSWQPQEKRVWRMSEGHDATYWCYATETQPGEKTYVLVIDPD